MPPIFCDTDVNEMIILKIITRSMSCHCYCPSCYLKNDICDSLYVLVQLLYKTSKNYSIPYTENKWGVVPADMDENGEIRVQFMTTIDSKRFTEIIN